MENLEKLLKTVEKNFTDKDKREKFEYVYNDNTFEVLTLTRKEKMDLMFSFSGDKTSQKDVYEWMKPCIYKTFQLKELAIRAKEEGYINTYYEIIDFLFEPEDFGNILSFIFKINNLKNFSKEVNELQKKQ